MPLSLHNVQQQINRKQYDNILAHFDSISTQLDIIHRNLTTLQQHFDIISSHFDNIPAISTIYIVVNKIGPTKASTNTLWFRPLPITQKIMIITVIRAWFS
jgi:hypothetical protein